MIEEQDIEKRRNKRRSRSESTVESQGKQNKKRKRLEEEEERNREAFKHAGDQMMIDYRNIGHADYTVLDKQIFEQKWRKLLKRWHKYIYDTHIEKPAWIIWIKSQRGTEKLTVWRNEEGISDPEVSYERKRKRDHSNNRQEKDEKTSKRPRQDRKEERAHLKPALGREDRSYPSSSWKEGPESREWEDQHMHRMQATEETREILGEYKIWDTGQIVTQDKWKPELKNPAVVIAKVGQKHIVVKSIYDENGEEETRVIEKQNFQADKQTSKQLYRINKEQARKLVYTRKTHREVADVLETIFNVSDKRINDTFDKGPDTVRIFYEMRKHNNDIDTMTQEDKEDHLDKMVWKFQNDARREKHSKGQIKGGKDNYKYADQGDKGDKGIGKDKQNK